MDKTPSSQAPVFIVEVDTAKKGVRQEVTRGAADKLRELTDRQMELAFAIAEEGGLR